jgi:hypothetical protein
VPPPHALLVPVKSLASLPVQLASHVSSACAHVSKVPVVKAIVGLQDMRASSAFNAHKMSELAATVRLHVMPQIFEFWNVTKIHKILKLFLNRIFFYILEGSLNLFRQKLIF